MSYIQENVRLYEEAYRKVTDHCMCGSLQDDGSTYRVLYPAGMILDGVQATHQGCGKRVALELILSAMERHWNESGIK